MKSKRANLPATSEPRTGETSTPSSPKKKMLTERPPVLRKAFFSYSTQDSDFVLQVASHLRRYLDCFVFEQDARAGRPIAAVLDDRLRSCEVAVVFVGSEFAKSSWQQAEVNALTTLAHDTRRAPRIVIVGLGGTDQSKRLPKKLNIFLSSHLYLPDKYTTVQPHRVVACARDIANAIELKWTGDDGLPYDSLLFDYEKVIIEFYLKKKRGSEFIPTDSNAIRGSRDRELSGKLFSGCPAHWPTVRKYCGRTESNILLRSLRKPGADEDYPESNVVAAALETLEASKHGFTFPEARPRKDLYYPQTANKDLNVGILVSGGIAPGINAAIDAIVQRHWLYSRYQQHKLRVYGFLNGFWALDNFAESTRLLRPDSSFIPGENVLQAFFLDTSEHATEGGSMLGTSRAESLKDPELRSKGLEEIATKLRHQNIHILYIIGGDGSMRAAHALWNVSQATPNPDGTHLSVVAIPKTMDNDILWAWQTFGFSSAVQKAREVLELMHTEIRSNPRLGVIQLYGSDSGFVVSHAVSASTTGHCDLALIPEDRFTMLAVARHLKKRICTAGRQIPYGLVVMAEAAIPEDALECLGLRPPQSHADLYVEISRRISLREEDRRKIVEFDNLRSQGKRMQGQTADELRRASLHIFTEALAILLPKIDIPNPPAFIPNWSKLRLVANEPRHLLRTVAPSTSDLTMAHRLGIAAVDNALAGYTDFMMSQWLTEFVLVPLELVVLGRKRIPRSGMFWESVLAKTGQPADLLH